MPFKVFVDGQEGTTGLEIYERLSKRGDIEILRIEPEKRKDINARHALINAADVVFLCLPDEAAKQSVSLTENKDTIIIDASTAHRTTIGWDYGLPELSLDHFNAVARSKRISNPGCFPTGFNLLIYPLVNNGIIPWDCRITCNSVTGYSGGGKPLITRFEDPANRERLQSPNVYALSLAHKHVPEMMIHGALLHEPLFSPMVCNHYKGMTVCIPLQSGSDVSCSADDIRDFLAAYYESARFVKVMPKDYEPEFGYISAQRCNDTNNLEIFVLGGKTKTLLCTVLDNLGKGASGAAVQNMNIALGLDEGLGL